jgi:hypothetical protein
MSMPKSKVQLINLASRKSLPRNSLRVRETDVQRSTAGWVEPVNQQSRSSSLNTQSTNSAVKPSQPRILTLVKVQRSKRELSKLTFGPMRTPSKDESR